MTASDLSYRLVYILSDEKGEEVIRTNQHVALARNEGTQAGDKTVWSKAAMFQLVAQDVPAPCAILLMRPRQSATLLS